MGKHKCPEFENHERWLVSYADMLTLLFAVFVTLYALKDGGGEPYIKQAAGSLQDSFATPLEQIPFDRRFGPDKGGLGIFENVYGLKINPPLPEQVTEARSLDLVAKDMRWLKKKIEERLYGPEKFRSQSERGAEKFVSVERTEKGFQVRLVANQYFNSGEFAIRKSAKAELKEIAKLLKSLNRHVSVEGHTDSLAPSGKLDNWELSALRATEILKYFVTAGQFPQTLISAVGYADIRPVAHNGTEAGRSLNRRVELHVSYDD